MLLRPKTARGEPSWADVRLWVEPLPAAAMMRSRKRLLQIVLLRCCGGNAERGLDVELDDETYRLHSLDRRRLQVAN